VMRAVDSLRLKKRLIGHDDIREFAEG